MFRVKKKNKRRKENLNMTRGRMAIIYDDGKLAVSIEFNGDMGPNNLGKDVIKELKQVHNDTDFCKAVVDFNTAHFQYDDLSIITTVTGDWYNTRHNYANTWSSDYIYIKNLTSEIRYFVTPNGFAALPPDEVLTLHFGKLLSEAENKLINISVGDIINVADIEWIVLKKNDDSVFCLTKDIIDAINFATNTANYAESKIRKYLKAFAEEIKNQIDENVFISREINLIKKPTKITIFGSVTDTIGLLTQDEYLEFKSIIEKYPVKHWWWLATADSRWEYQIRCVRVDGKLQDRNVRNIYGIRPACLFSAKVFEQ